jgi:hypothetical protein
MTKAKLVKISLVNAGSALLYIAVVTFLMSHGEKLFGQTNGILGGMAILLLFVLSATIMGFIILGRPLLMYLDGFKKEALKLFYLTVMWLILIAVVIFLGLTIF